MASALVEINVGETECELVELCRVVVVSGALVVFGLFKHVPQQVTSLSIIFESSHDALSHSAYGSSPNIHVSAIISMKSEQKKHHHMTSNETGKRKISME